MFITVEFALSLILHKPSTRMSIYVIDNMCLIKVIRSPTLETLPLSAFVFSCYSSIVLCSCPWISSSCLIPAFIVRSILRGEKYVCFLLML